MNVKVIATSFSTGRIKRVPRERAVNYPDHYQDIDDQEAALEQIKAVVNWELKQVPGVPLDLIIVNSDVGYEEGNEYIKGLDGLKTRYGKIKIIQRPNIGWSFGAYSDAYKKYRKDYENWMFVEEDILVGGVDYYKKVLERLKGKVGFVAMVKVCDHRWGRHAGGGVGLTNREVLDKVWKIHGMLPHCKREELDSGSIQRNRDFIIQEGEVEFTNTIFNLGYELEDYGNARQWNLEANLCIPYYHFKHDIKT